MTEHYQNYSFYPNKKCCNKKVCNIFEKMCYKNWYNRDESVNRQFRLYIFTIAIESAGGKPADFFVVIFQ